MTNAWTLLPTLPPIPAGASASGDVAVCVRYADGRLDWLKGKMIARPDGGQRWQVATAERCTVLAWKRIELPEIAEPKR